MDNALACLARGWGPNRYKNKEDFFCLEKINYVILSPLVPLHMCSFSLSLSLSLSRNGSFLQELRVNLSQGRQ